MSQSIVNKKSTSSIMTALNEAVKFDEKHKKSPEEVIKRFLTRRPESNSDDDTTDLYVLTKNVSSAEKALRAAGVAVVKSSRENSVESIITVK